MPESIAGIISQGTGYRLQAEAAKGEALSKIGGAVGQGVTSLGVGIFKMAAKAKEEREIKSVDDEFKGASVTGDLRVVAETAARLAPTITTLRGKEYLKQKVDGLRGIARDMVNIKADEATIAAKNAELAEAPFRKAAISWARKNPMSNEVPEEYAPFAQEIRQEQDQAREIEDARALEESEGILGGRSPGALTDEDLAGVKSPRVKGILRGQRDTQRRFDTSAEERRAKEERASRFRTLKAQGLVEVEDPDTGEVRTIPDVSSTRYQDTQREREKANRRRDRALTLAEEKERRYREAAAKGDSARALDEQRGALSDYRAAYRLMQDDFGDMKDDVDPDEYEALYEKIQTMTEELGGKTGQGGGDQTAEALKAALRKALGK